MKSAKAFALTLWPAAHSTQSAQLSTSVTEAQLWVGWGPADAGWCRKQMAMNLQLTTFDTGRLWIMPIWKTIYIRENKSFVSFLKSRRQPKTSSQPVFWKPGLQTKEFLILFLSFKQSPPTPLIPTLKTLSTKLGSWGPPAIEPFWPLRSCTNMLNFFLIRPLRTHTSRLVGSLTWTSLLRSTLTFLIG